MKKLYKKLKGFTLTELIVVIAIIGILAAVLIPSITGYIKKAKRSTDVQMAGEMTREIQWYCLDNDMNQDNITGTDVRTMLLLRGYDLTPSTKDWSYVYNKDSKKVEVTDFKKGEIAGALDYTPIDPTEIKKDRYLIGEGQNPIEQAVKTLCNLETLSEYDEIMAKTTSDKGDLVKYKEYLELFSPLTTLYVNNFSILTDNAWKEKSKIVFLIKTVNAPQLSSKNYDFKEGFSVTFPECILSSDIKNQSLSTNSNTNFIDLSTENENLQTISFDVDINKFQLGVAYNKAISFSVSYETISVTRDVTHTWNSTNSKFDFTGITMKSGKTITGLNQNATEVEIDNAISKSGYYDNIEKIKIIEKRIIKVCYYGEKGLFAFGKKEITEPSRVVYYNEYLELVKSINQ